MFVVFAGLHKAVLRIALLFTALLLSACVDTGTGTGPRINTAAPVQVALLVPAASQQPGDQIMAQNLENAARLAITDLQDVQIDLRVYATDGDPAQAAEMARLAVNDGAKILLGPLYGQSASAAGAAVANRNVNVLAFSNNTAVAGGNIFVLGQTFENTADRLVAYAQAQGKGSIAVVYGQTASEEFGRDAITSAIARNGAILAASNGFEMSQQGVIDAVPRITESVAVTGAQSVFFTSDNAGAMVLLQQLLPEKGLGPDTTQYIGLTRLDIPASSLELRGLQGSWFAIPDQGMSNGFSTRYTAAYGQPPHVRAGLAYDGIAAIGALIQAGDSNALNARGLTRPEGFAGVSGIFRLFNDGTNERGLSIATIQDSQVIEIDPAPRAFGGPGF
jgi:predicted small secreted protein